MPAASRLGAQLSQVTAALRQIGVRYALIGGDERIDLLYAHRPIAKRLLAGAAELDTSLGSVRVISSEGLIGFKLQGLVNDPRRTQDLEDIRALLRANRGHLDLAEVREYFELFDRGSLLDELLRETF